MAQKGGTLLLLLIVACAVLAERPFKGPFKRPERRPDFKDKAKQLMKKCLEKGCPMPNRELITSVFNNSDSPMEGRDAEQINTVQSTFMNILDSVSDVKGPRRQLPKGDSDKMKNKVWNCSKLINMMKHMKNSSEESVCYMRAFVAPVSWEALSANSDNMSLDNYDTVVWGAEPLLQDMPNTKIRLPSKEAPQKVNKVMGMLQKSYETMSEDQKRDTAKWMKQQISQIFYNCTTRPSSEAKSSMMATCTSSQKWQNYLEKMTLFMFHLEASDVDSSPKEKLCEFFRTPQFKSNLGRIRKMKSSLARMFLEKCQECFSGEEFAENVDKLGPLCCQLSSVPDMTPERKTKLLSRLNSCDNPGIRKLKKRLCKSVMANPNATQVLNALGISVVFVPPEKLAEMVGKNLTKFAIPLTKLTKKQKRFLFKKVMGNVKCKKMSRKELMDLAPLAECLPSCMLKRLKARDLLNDRETLKNISSRMGGGQSKAFLQAFKKDMSPSEMMEMLPGPLRSYLSLIDLKNSDITSLEQVKDLIWTKAQSAYLVEKLKNKLVFRKLRAIRQGVTCEMIEKVADDDVEEMVEGLIEGPKWQAVCVARKFFATLEKERADYFKTITEDEMENIHPTALLHLPDWKVKDLPNSVCSVLLDKMETADLSKLPRRARSRLAFAQRALLCLTNGTTDLSGLTTDDVSRLGQLLCELMPSQLRRMAPDVLNSSLEGMASCQSIPQRHIRELIQLVNQTFGHPSNLSGETCEKLGCLLLRDDNATLALPNKPWMRDVLFFLRVRCVAKDSDALKKKMFILITTTSDPARKKRTATTTTDAKVPTEDLIEELGPDNVMWTDAQLSQMSTETFTATVEILGNISDYNADQLAALSEKATLAFGPVSQMTESEVTQLGCITQGFSNADLEMLPFSLDTLEEIAHCGWNESQLEPVWRAAAKHNKLTAQQLESADMVALNCFICGLNSSEIAQLDMDAFKDAIGSMNDIRCSFNTTQQFKSLAVAAFGDPSTWSAAEVSELGIIVAGLDAIELASLKPSVFSFFSESAIPLILPNNLAALSLAQLEALGPDNADMVTTDQLEALTAEQQATLESVISGPRDQSQKPPESRAPSLSVEGASAYMKPLLFFLTMFLLL